MKEVNIEGMDITLTPALKCIKCGEIKPEDDFYINPKNLTGRTGACKECIREYQKEYRSRSDVIERNKEYHKQYAKLNRDKLASIQKKHRDANQLKSKARSKVNHALRDGRLYKPKNCVYCCSTDKLHAHHTSYEESMWLNVVWLCKECHLKADKDLI